MASNFPATSQSFSTNQELTMGLRAVVAMMQHETNTFSPVPTPLSRFGSDGMNVPTGDEVKRAFAGTGTGIGAFLDIATDAGMEVVTPVAGNAAPSGKVQADAYAFMTNAICEAVAAGCDVCFLDLHGAMVPEGDDDGEGPLLARIRRIAPDLPIAISLDLHANITPAIVENCDVLVGFKTYPHIDMYQAGQHAGSIMVRAMAGEVTPVMSWGSRPILAQTLRMGHVDEPMGPLLEMARQKEAQGLLAASVFGGFPLADIWGAGLSVVTVADGDPGLAAEARDLLLDAAWAEREEFMFTSLPLSETVARAKNFADGPTILLDHADNAASGGTEDTVAVLAEVIEQGLENVAMFAICDPEAVRLMHTAGVGAQVSLQLGGKVDMPTIGRVGEPLAITGTVGALTDGVFEITAEMGRGTKAAMGPSARLDAGDVQIVVISRHTEPFDLGHFRSLGIEPTEKRYLVLKSRIHFRAGFGDIAVREIPCDGVGVTSSDNDLFDFRHVRRPIFPLDPSTPPTPEYPPSSRL
jgi:microcystin degradation protein MlrC